MASGPQYGQLCSLATFDHRRGGGTAQNGWFDFDARDLLFEKFDFFDEKVHGVFGDPAVHFGICVQDPHARGPSEWWLRLDEFELNAELFGFFGCSDGGSASMIRAINADTDWTRITSVRLCCCRFWDVAV